MIRTRIIEELPGYTFVACSDEQRLWDVYPIPATPTDPDFLKIVERTFTYHKTQDAERQKRWENFKTKVRNQHPNTQ